MTKRKPPKGGSKPIKQTTTTNRQIVQTLRYIEWERAKGSLNAILASLWGWDISRSGSDDDVSFKELAKMVKEFVEKFGEAAALD